MSLKLFRSTGYSSILAPGETTRVSLHPAWLVLAVSVWIGVACNVALWRVLRSMPGSGSLLHALATGLLLAGAAGTVLSLLGWRRTLKPAATLLLLIAALASCGLWIQGLPMDSSALNKGLRALMLPSWASLLGWQVPLMLVVLALVPMLWVWNAHLRRLPGPRQLGANAAGVGVGLAVVAACALLAIPAGA